MYDSYTDWDQAKQFLIVEPLGVYADEHDTETIAELCLTHNGCAWTCVDAETYWRIVEDNAL